MNPILSIIIPTFNSSDYILDLLYSINKNFNKIKAEVILVDDGSTDDTLNLIDTFSFSKNIIKIIIKLLHKGAAHARNKGLKKASGHYIMFCDSDDIITASPEFLLQEKSSYDIISMNKDVSLKNNGKCYQGNLSKSEILISMLLGNSGSFISGEYSMGPYMKLFKRGFLLQESIFFPENYKWWEDLLFNVKAIIKAKSIKFVKFNYYEQRNNFKSISHNIDQDCLVNAVMVLEDTKKLLISLKSRNNKQIIEQLKAFLVWSVFTGYLVFHPNMKNYEYIVNNITLEKELVKIAPNLQAKLLILSLEIIGFYPTVLWYGTLKKAKNSLEKKNDK